MDPSPLTLATGLISRLNLMPSVLLKAGADLIRTSSTSHSKAKNDAKQWRLEKANVFGLGTDEAYMAEIRLRWFPLHFAIRFSVSSLFTFKYGVNIRWDVLQNDQIHFTK